MKIKTDFITNSSSTSFILAFSGEFTFGEFLKLMGAKEDSPLIPIFDRLFMLIKREMRQIDEVEFVRIVDEIHPNIVNKLMEHKKRGGVIYQGDLSTEDGDPIEAMFCVDSFEAESENIYLNYLECVW